MLKFEIKLIRISNVRNNDGAIMQSHYNMSIADLKSKLPIHRCTYNN